MQAQFELFRQAYPGGKRTSDTEFAHLVCTHKDWRSVVPLLLIRLEAQKAYRVQMVGNGTWVPQWPFLKNWIRDRCWEMEYGEGKKTYYCQGCGAQVDPVQCYSEGGKVYCTSKCKYVRSK